ncbi:TolC family protein, partial [Candidatus Sumerlaeota bacterium]|nr:TolC family protein [Candidatus Sumerlaeota bacterium]
APAGAGGNSPADAEASAILSGKVSLDQILALTAGRSPEIQAARESWRASLRRFEQASYLEDLVTQYRSFVRELDTKVGPQTHKEMLADTFPFPSALALKGQMVDLEAEAMRLEYRATARRVLNESARKFFEIGYLNQTLDAIAENAALFSQMEEIARAQLQSGRAPQSDVLRAQAERAMIETELKNTREERLNMIAEVNAMMGLPVATSWGEVVLRDVGGVSPALDDAIRSALGAKQELLKAQTESRMAEVAVHMAETMVYPRGSQGMSQLSLGTGAEAGPTRSMMAAFPDRAEPDTAAAGFGPNAAWIDELRVRAQEAQKNAAQEKTRAEFAVKDGLFKADAARREFVTLRDQVVPRTAQGLANVQERYSAGSASFIEYLDAARASLKARLDRERARRDLNKAWVEVEEARGRTAISSSASEGAHR